MMFRVYDATTGKPLSFKYAHRDQAEHVQQTMKDVKTLVMACRP